MDISEGPCGNLRDALCCVWYLCGDRCIYSVRALAGVLLVLDIDILGGVWCSCDSCYIILCGVINGYLV